MAHFTVFSHHIYDHELEPPLTLKDFIELILKEVPEEYRDNVLIGLEKDYDGHSNIKVLYTRPETAKERSRRIEIERYEKQQVLEAKEREKRNEIATLNRLKEKYPNA